MPLGVLYGERTNLMGLYLGGLYSGGKRSAKPITFLSFFRLCNKQQPQMVRITFI